MNTAQKMLLPRKSLSSRTLLPPIRPFSFTNLAVARLIGLTPGIPEKVILDLLSSVPSRFELTPFHDLLSGVEGINKLNVNHTHVLRRIGWRMRVNRIHDLESYQAFVAHNPAELPALRKSMSMHISAFFQKPEVFFAIERCVAPVLFTNPSLSGINILVEDCKTGERAYSIAMLLHFLRQEIGHSCTLRVIALSENKKALNQARTGLYPHLVTTDLSPMCLDKFFMASPEGYHINDQLKKSVQFDDRKSEKFAPHQSFDLLITSQKSHQEEAGQIDHYRNLLKPGGFLVFQPANHTEKISAYFDVIEARNGVFRKRIATTPNPESITPKRIHPIKPSVSLTPAQEIEKMVEKLEKALNTTQERLNLTIDEYESTHDELVDMNHQLQSSMVELSHENDQVQAECNSLRSTMNSLMAANKSLKQQNEKLQAMNSRMETITSLCGVGILYLNQELCVDTFSSDIAPLFNLKKIDVGRPFSHLESPFQVHLFESAKSVLRSRTSVEQECKNKEGIWYRVHVSPHIQKDNIVGVVISFLDITESKRENEWDRFRAKILNQIQDAIIVTNRSGRVTYLNKAAIDRFGLYHRKKTGFLVDDLYESEWLSSAAEEIARETLNERGDWSGEVYHITPDGKRKRVKVMVHLLEDEAGKEIGQLTVIRNSFEKDLHDNDSLIRIIEDLSERNESFSMED